MLNLFPDSPLRCYYCSPVPVSSVTGLFTHYITEHKHEKFSVRQLDHSERSERRALHVFPKSVNFPLRVDAIQNRIVQRNKCVDSKRRH